MSFGVFRNKTKEFVGDLIVTAVNRLPLNGNKIKCKGEAHPGRGHEVPEV
jgi:hypothetical protein